MTAWATSGKEVNDGGGDDGTSASSWRPGSAMPVADSLERSYNVSCGGSGSRRL